MPKVFFTSLTKSEAVEFYSSKAGISNKILRIEAMTQAVHIVTAAVLLKYISGKFDSYSVPLIVLEVVGLYIAISMVMIWVLKFERSLARKRLEQ